MTFLLWILLQLAYTHSINTSKKAKPKQFRANYQQCWSSKMVSEARRMTQTCIKIDSVIRTWEWKTELYLKLFYSSLIVFNPTKTNLVLEENACEITPRLPKKILIFVVESMQSRVFAFCSGKNCERKLWRHFKLSEFFSMLLRTYWKSSKKNIFEKFRINSAAIVSLVVVRLGGKKNKHITLS